jgi:type II restriction enzyme
MALDLVDYERKAHEAVKAFWGNRKAARQKQIGFFQRQSSAVN